MNRDKLKNLTLNITDGEHGSIIDSLNSSYYLLSNKNIKNGKINITNDDRKISIDSFNKIRKRTKLSNNDVVVASVGTIGKTAIIKSNNINFDFQRSVAIIKPNQSKITSDYLYYFFNVPYVKKQLQNKANGAVQKCLYINDFENLDIDYHDILTQQKITSILSIFDEKMELNNKINSELEKIVKTLYDYWFVQFDFPDEDGKPYKSSGGKMVWNEELKKDIPEGWEVKKLNNLLRKNIDKFILNGNKHGINTIDLSVMPSATMCLAEKNTSDKFGSNLFKMNKFDILFGGIRPYLLKAGFAPFDGLVTGTVHSYRVINNFDYNFTILTVVHNSFFKFAVSNSKGTKMPIISSNDLLSYQLAYKEDVVKKFNQLISFKEIISKNIQENHDLAKLRDFILPMLMNGQVTIM